MLIKTKLPIHEAKTERTKVRNRQIQNHRDFSTPLSAMEEQAEKKNQ